MQVPKTEGEWKSVADNFNTQWQFPHCIGAMDGKHILIQPLQTVDLTTSTTNTALALCCWQ